MNLASRQNIQLLLKKHGLKPLKRFGQNFLIDAELAKKIASAAEINAQNTVLEIGPGIGAITRELAKRAEKVVAVEKDRNMVEILKETLKEFKNIEIIHDDIRISDFPNIDDRKSDIPQYKVVGNLPFYLTAPVIRKFLEMKGVRLQSMTLVVQKEVGQRICAKPPKMSILANSVQFYADAEIISVISKKSFFPEPKVDAALIKITPRPMPAGDSKIFFEVVKAGFAQPRKQLLNNLARGLKKSREEVAARLEKNNISPRQRAETLTLENWLNLAKSFKID